ncbi:MAG: hypothetical protein MZU95_08765 [Desulfomicrobium escambiense]|nr:hypothetical protein [Desulfomicrobium escambiense]
MKDLKEFIQRFSSNASKSRQATSRKKILEKLDARRHRRPPAAASPTSASSPTENPATTSSSMSGHLARRSEGRAGTERLRPGPSAHGDKIAFVGREHLAKTALFRHPRRTRTPDSGRLLLGTDHRRVATSPRTTLASSTPTCPSSTGSGSSPRARTRPTSAPSWAGCFSAGTRPRSPCGVLSGGRRCAACFRG